MSRAASSLLLVVAVLLVAPAASAQPDGDGVVLTLTPARVECGTLYNGTVVKLAADVPRCDGVVVEIQKDGETVVLNRKGRVGFIWLNVAKVTVTGAPQVYILASSGDITSMCSPEERSKLGIGLSALEEMVSFQSETPLGGDEFAEFLKFKRHRGTYNDDVAIDLHAGAEGRRRAEAAIPIPSAAPSGEYDVRLYCFRDGVMIDETATKLTIESVGLPRLLYELAHEHAAVYGIVAVLVAMLAGLTTGVVFASRGERGR
jgi:uncharacterized protein (TIGR02186 family)